MNNDTSFRINIGFLVSILVGLVILLIIIAPIKNNETSNEKCSEIKKILSNDKEYKNLQNYPNILNDLKEYENDRCDSNEGSGKQ
tara:strand:+ start:440 stop:694 length:255 start_codon:yes stop_codon:yes gene_type:complete